MATIQRIQLSERNVKTGQIVKNESFLYGELKELIKKRNPGYFSHWFYGKTRTAALEKVFASFSKLTDLDKPGRSRIDIR